MLEMIDFTDCEGKIHDYGGLSGKIAVVYNEQLVFT